MLPMSLLKKSAQANSGESRNMVLIQSNKWSNLTKSYLCAYKRSSKKVFFSKIESNDLKIRKKFKLCICNILKSVFLQLYSKNITYFVSIQK